MPADRILDNGAGIDQCTPATGGRAALSRRDFLIQGTSVLALLALMEAPLWAQLQDASEAETIVPFLDQPPAPPEAIIQQLGELNQLNWQQLTSWITPNGGFFNVSHYNRPVIRPEDWRLEIGGLVERPVNLTLDQLKARPRQEVIFTLECSGNHGFEWFVGGVGNAKWAGTPLAPLLKEAGIKRTGIEVVFFGSDQGEEEVRNIKMTQSFSRSMSVEDALAPTNLLCYEMNGEPLPQLHGFPLRLIAPGWYGVANVKWLTRIEVIDQRWAGRFMTKDYVTIREEPREDGGKIWTQKIVGRSLIKSVTARVAIRHGKHRIYGAAWGAPIHRVEVRIDEGPWRPATIDQGPQGEFAWKFWYLDWEAKPGDHAITSRAIDTTGNIQPAMTDPVIAGKRTYWESNGQITRRIRTA